ncbi:MAG: isoprenyl transferase [Candidatus Omnitrophica bacterium]|nr:isoprenyl transferase [Candidatus Omnitrophota bacterium]HOX54254.1 isoprenyl transferase [Candidatus Omnitrophota bacterium]
MDNLPQHIAIIMDGNGRWAKQRGLPRAAGHKAGIDNFKKIVKDANGIGIKYLTLFAFSTENWKRPKTEVGMLMRALEKFLDRELAELNKNNIRLRIVGRDDPIPKNIIDKLKKAEGQTKNNTGLTLNLALNYGSRTEIVDAAKKLAKSILNKTINIEDVDERVFSEFLYTADTPDPDLLIRTSGEMRISNFLLWQLSYAELYFTNKFWPDFHKEDLLEAIREFQSRQRRFGDVNPV